eukprot:3051499-Prymnesium_polylepis.2
MPPTSDAELSRSFMAMLHSKDVQIRQMGDRLASMTQQISRMEARRADEIRELLQKSERRPPR